MPNPRRKQNLTLIPATIAAAALFAASCSSGDKGNSNGDSGGESGKLASRISAKPSIDKRSRFEPTSDSGDKKSFKAGAFTSKEFKSKEFRGSKSYKTDPYKDGDQRSPWAGLTSRESAQEVPSNLKGNYATESSGFAGKTSRDSGASYGTGTYQTETDIIGTNAQGDASPPKMVPNVKTTQGMNESEIKTLLGKD